LLKKYRAVREWALAVAESRLLSSQRL
jgi:hypothetical protein